MEAWLMTLASLCVCCMLLIIRSRAFRNSLHHLPLPPGPLHIPILSNILWLTTYSFSQLHPLLRNLHAKHGPIITFYIWSRPLVSISHPSLAHQALVQNGAAFADRPNKALFNNSDQQLKISSSSYGPTWRLLRRNLASEMLAPSRFPSFSGLRKRVLDDLLDRLKLSSSHCCASSIRVIDHVHHAMFSLLAFMCFGERVHDNQIERIKRIQRRLISSFNRFSVLNVLPAAVSRVLFPHRWKELLHLREEQKRVFAQLIGARKKRLSKDKNECFVCYADTLLNLKLTEEEERKLDEGELVTLCSEFLSAGTDTTSTAMEWVMANLVKYPRVQMRLVEEIGEVMGEREGNGFVKEEDLPKLPYLRAVILEGLRRHPPSLFLVPHAVSEDVIVNGSLVPKNGTVNFMVAEMGWDPNVWEDPMAFKPERFLSGGCGSVEAFDVSGSKEIKMMPFGAGRRICPAYNLAMLHLGYFVANLVWNFEWTASNGGDVDLSEKQEFTVVMKHALQAHIAPRNSQTPL